MALLKKSFTAFPQLSDFFNDEWFRNRMDVSNWTPAINVVDNADNYEIEVAAPGLKKEDFDVSVENGILTVSGKTEKEEDEKKKNYTRKEFSSRSFSNSFTLPEHVNTDHIEAKHENGILHLRLKKNKTQAPTKKQVQIG